jgi:ornithine carbamoyltransferase
LKTDLARELTPPGLFFTKNKIIIMRRKMDHFINFKDMSPDFLEKIVDQAITLKHQPEKFGGALAGKKMYMLFQKTSTRTALSFAQGMAGLGGEYFLQNWEDSNFAVGEICDEVRYVASNVDIILARLKTSEDINLMGSYSTVPVINACCNKYHPCQAIADLITIKEKFGDFNIKLVYIGVRNNVLNSLMDSLPRLGGELIAITPLLNGPSSDDELYKTALKTGRFHDIGSGNPTPGDLTKWAKEADILYTDTWIDMEFMQDPQYDQVKKERIAKMLPFQINGDILKGSKAVVMHDMPIHAGYEISRDVVENNMETILEQAGNKKYAAQSILLTLLT